ncbi:hypothetical protein [Picosynechococcus sp. PCC 8807]|uniref:hypothetical protein n=1 Tax=Picosynechococcus sp. PCC 8807 TaxID=195248 RepID=UPI000810DAB7|nr:hypothetical protein [Picosynechococcus sp. PCC 8807]ANV90775.1 hypothetical protein AWQ24_09100 [Picosynechococcus sp. PCC 8807]
MATQKAPPATAAKKRGAITWKIGNNVYQFSGSYQNYRDVASSLGMTVYDDTNDIKIDDNDVLIKGTQAAHVLRGSAVALTAELKDGVRTRRSTILVPVNKLEDVLVNNILTNKSFGKGKITDVRGRLQQVVTI